LNLFRRLALTVFWWFSCKSRSCIEPLCSSTKSDAMVSSLRCPWHSGLQRTKEGLRNYSPTVLQWSNEEQCHPLDLFTRCPCHLWYSSRSKERRCPVSRDKQCANKLHHLTFWHWSRHGKASKATLECQVCQSKLRDGTQINFKDGPKSCPSRLLSA
jgi:hypothetical protein